MNQNLMIGVAVLFLIELPAIWLAKPWELPENRSKKLRRSLILGVFTGLGVSISLMVIFNGISLDLFSIKQLSAFGWVLLCFGLPAVFIATIGYYLGYKQLSWLSDKKRKILNSSADTKE